MLKKIIKDKLTVKIFENRALAGKDAARDGANAIRELLAKQEWVNIIFAAAPSQNDTLAALFEEPGIDWTRCRAFHMDEYVGFPKDKKESFGYYLYEHVFGKLPFGEVHYVGGDNPDPEAECQRYGDLLTKYPTDIVFLGIGRVQLLHLLEEVENESGNAGTIFDLQGRKVENPTKGIYIIDGKKVLVK